MSEPSGEEVLVLPPLPLATGRLLPGGGADPAARRVAEVALVVRTEDGAEHRLPLVEQHGAWWAPGHARWVPSTDRATSAGNRPHPEG